MVNALGVLRASVVKNAPKTIPHGDTENTETGLENQTWTLPSLGRACHSGTPVRA